ncbi:MAG: DNA repair protein RecN, partial [Pseudomonadota bacterium]|nr:DNA repair protein RecN [Pseudomonadota bacterium]
RALGASRQVLCVTHLAQVAARGAQHLSVSKAQERELAVIITPLGRPQRIEEIACMAGGSELNPQSLAHAEAMLDNATADDAA